VLWTPLSFGVGFMILKLSAASLTALSGRPR
jgi:hypothetical protein